MDKQVEFYELTKVTIQPPKPGEITFATAALMNCKLCGTCIDGMGGPGESICITCGDELKAGRHAARARVRLHAAAKCAVDHLEHMAKWISARGEGYSLESLGEDISEIRAAIENAEDQSGPIVVDIGEAVKMLQASPELGSMLMTSLIQSVSSEDLSAELVRRAEDPPLSRYRGRIMTRTPTEAMGRESRTSLPKTFTIRQLAGPINRCGAAGLALIVIGVPWEMVAPHESRFRSYFGHSLRAAHYRGGATAGEILAVLEGKPWDFYLQDIVLSQRKLVDLVVAWQAQQRRSGGR